MSTPTITTIRFPSPSIVILSLIYSGKKNPNNKTIAIVCKVLEVSQAVLYIISIEDSDVPNSQKEMFNELYP